MGVKQARNFRQVSDEVMTAGILTAAQFSGLASERIECVVNLLPDDSPHALPGEREIVTAQGLEYRYIPVDFAGPTVDDFDQFAATMDAVEGRRVLVHCAANYRVSAFYALYAEARGKWSAEEGNLHVAGLWSPQDYPAWPAFMRAVRARIEARTCR